MKMDPADHWRNQSEQIYTLDHSETSSGDTSAKIGMITHLFSLLELILGGCKIINFNKIRMALCLKSCISNTMALLDHILI